MKFTIEEFISQLPLKADEKWKEGVWDIEAFARDGMRLVFFAPRGADYQTSHEDDEFYFIVRGKGDTVIENHRFPCENGDAFYIPAKTDHHFENFTDDFATWAVFS